MTIFGVTIRISLYSRVDLTHRFRIHQVNRKHLTQTSCYTPTTSLHSYDWESSSSSLSPVPSHSEQCTHQDTKASDSIAMISTPSLVHLADNVGHRRVLNRNKVIQARGKKLNEN